MDEFCNRALGIAETSEWFDWLRKELPLGGVSLPHEEDAVLYIEQAIHMSYRVQGIYGHLPEPMRSKLIMAAIVFQCWKLQRDLRERARIPRRAAILPTVTANTYLQHIGCSGRHHLVEANDGFTYVVTIPSSLWAETLSTTEILCNELARIFGLTVPTAAIVVLAPDLLRRADLKHFDPSRLKNRQTPKQCVGFRHLSNTEDQRDIFEVCRRDRAVRNQVLGRLVFDLWVGNFRPSGLMLNSDDTRSGKSAVFFDHTKCLAGDDLSRFLNTSEFGDCCPRIQFSAADERTLQKWVRTARSLDLNPLWDLLIDVPPYWYGSYRGKYGEVLQALEFRKAFLKSEVDRMTSVNAYVPKKGCRADRGCACGTACRLSGLGPVVPAPPKFPPRSVAELLSDETSASVAT